MSDFESCGLIRKNGLYLFLNASLGLKELPFLQKLATIKTTNIIIGMISMVVPKTKPNLEAAGSYHRMTKLQMTEVSSSVGVRYLQQNFKQFLQKNVQNLQLITGRFPTISTHFFPNYMNIIQKTEILRLFPMGNFFGNLLHTFELK